ncbi:MAG TPA: GAF domain-containing protein [Gemmataceae bacterium]|jgi:GAF domain-containing protein|nr:GAF domain-containing protein [Gemmataceae bacterium]
MHLDRDSSIRGELENRLSYSATESTVLQTALEFVLEQLGCVAGTIHSLEAKSSMLCLRARRNIPDALLPRIQQIPIGKGMAGLAAERGEPVQVCNLQTNTSGVAKPGAKETGMEGSIALPIRFEGRMLGVLGVAKPTIYEFKKEEIALLVDLAEVIGRFMAPANRPAANPERRAHG